MRGWGQEHWLRDFISASPFSSPKQWSHKSNLLLNQWAEYLRSIKNHTKLLLKGCAPLAQSGSAGSGYGGHNPGRSKPVCILHTHPKCQSSHTTGGVYILSLYPQPFKSASFGLENESVRIEPPRAAQILGWANEWQLPHSSKCMHFTGANVELYNMNFPHGFRFQLWGPVSLFLLSHTFWYSVTHVYFVNSATSRQLWCPYATLDSVYIDTHSILLNTQNNTVFLHLNENCNV